MCVVICVDTFGEKSLKNGHAIAEGSGHRREGTCDHIDVHIYSISVICFCFGPNVTRKTDGIKYVTGNGRNKGNKS